MAEPTETLMLDITKKGKPTLGGISLEYESTMVSSEEYLGELNRFHFFLENYTHNSTKSHFPEC